MSLALLPSRPQSRAAVHGCRADAVHQRRALAQGGPVRARAQPQRRRGACGCLRPMLGRPAPACIRAWRGPCRPQDRTPGSTIWSTSDGPKPVLNMTLGRGAGAHRRRVDVPAERGRHAAAAHPRARLGRDVQRHLRRRARLRRGAAAQAPALQPPGPVCGGGVQTGSAFGGGIASRLRRPACSHHLKPACTRLHRADTGGPALQRGVAAGGLGAGGTTSSRPAFCAVPKRCSTASTRRLAWR